MTAPPHRPLTADDLRPGDPYELSDGRLVECLPTGQRGSKSNIAGGAVLAADPAVEAAGVDAGVAPKPNMLRAPDIAVGNLGDEPGWAKSAPLLAVEYADTGQDEAELQQKLDELLAAGTKVLWVVRLADGDRRVEVHEAGSGAPTYELAGSGRRSPIRIRRPARVAYPGEWLAAPGILKNPVLVEALYDRDAAHAATLRNLLQRKGYEDLEAVLESGRLAGLKEGRLAGLKESRIEGLRAVVHELCDVLDIDVPAERLALIQTMDEGELAALRDHLKRQRRWP